MKKIMMLMAAMAVSAGFADYAKRDIFTDGEFFVGCNYWCRNAGMYMWSRWDPATLEKEIGELAKYGVSVMRVFPLWSDFQPLTGDCTSGGWYRSYRFRDNRDLPNAAGVDDEMIARFRYLCDVCQKHDVKLIVGIITGWMSGRQFVPSVFEEKNVLNDPPAIMWQTRFVKYFVEQLKDHPAIAAWDYGNECNVMGSGGAGQAGFYNWMDHIGMAIKSKDATRPVVSGMHGLQTSETECDNVRLNGEISDILCTHPYALYVPGCGKEAFNTMRTALHPTAESLLYSGLGGKPCFVEEVGNLGSEYTSDERTAAGVRTTMFSAWANDLKGLLWWCNSDQENLDFPPYTLTACERELGLIRSDWTPKPVMLEMKKFEDFRHSLPFRKLSARTTNCCIIVPEKINGWLQSFGCYLLAKQAGLEPVFAGAEGGELPEAPLYVVASVDQDNGYSYRAQKKWQAKAREGATVVVIVRGNSRYTHFNEWTGLKVDYGCRSGIERRFVFGGSEMSVSDDFTMRVLPDRAEVLAATADGEPVFSVFPYGKGKVIVVNGPVDMNSIDRSDCFTGEKLCDYWKLFAKAKELAGVRMKVEKRDCPYVGITEHPAADGSTIVMAINFEPREMTCPIKIRGKLKRVWRGQVAADRIKLAPNEAALFEVVGGDVPWRAAPEEVKEVVGWMIDPAERPVDTNEVVVAEPPKDMKLFLLIGQSNMAGRGKVSEEDAKAIPRCLKLNRDLKWAEATTPIHYDRITSGYGIVNTFVKRYLEEHPKDTVGLVPCAVGGSLSVTWSPETAADPVGTNLRRTLQRAKAAQRHGAIAGILWHQGEADCGLLRDYPAHRERYIARLVEIAKTLRTELKCPDAPFLVGGIGTLPVDCTSMNPVLEEAAKRIPNAAFIPAADLKGHLPDGVHFDTPSYKVFGSRYYDAYKRLKE